MVNPPFKSDLFYSVQNEDYQTELAVLKRIYQGTPLRVLMVASSGENALSLLTQTIVASVVAVDLNPAQLHLCELRRTTSEILTRDEQLRLLGADLTIFPGDGQAERLDLYQRVRSHLPEPTRVFWDDRREREIAFGLHHAGRNDVCMHDIQACLQAAGFAPLRQLGTRERLHLQSGNLIEKMTSLAATYGTFDLISISNIADWMSEEQFGALVIQSRDCLNPGGALLARTATSRSMIVEVMGQHLSMDHPFNTELQQVERGPWFRIIAAGFQPEKIYPHK